MPFCDKTNNVNTNFIFNVKLVFTLLVQFGTPIEVGAVIF